MQAGDESIEQTYFWMRSHLQGFLRFDGERMPIRVVVAPDGSFVAPVMVAMLTSTDLTLELPDDADDHLQMMVSFEQFQERGPMAGLCDRWRIYHGKPEDVNWARIQIDAARFRGFYVDGSALMRPNPWTETEAATCRKLNAIPKPQLSAAIRTLAGVDVEQPVVVGVDPWGADVRRRFDVVRVTAAQPPWGTPADLMGALGAPAL